MQLHYSPEMTVQKGMWQSPKHKSSSGLLEALGMTLGSSFSWLRAWLQEKEYDRIQCLLPNPGMVIPGHENLPSDRSRTWQFFWNRSRTLCPLSLEQCTLVQIVMHNLCRLAEPGLPVTKAVIASLHAKPSLRDTNCACGTAGLPQRSQTPSYSTPSHFTSWRLVTTCNQFRLLFQLSCVHFSPCPASVHYCLLFIFPSLWKLTSMFWF